MDKAPITTGRFLAKRGFYLAGKRIAPDTVVHLDDPATISMLIELNKIEPADECTRSRLKRSELITWEEPREPRAGIGRGTSGDGPWQPATETGIFRALRN